MENSKPIRIHISRVAMHIENLIFTRSDPYFTLEEIKSILYNRIKLYYFEYLKEGGILYLKEDECIGRAIDLLLSVGSLKVEYFSEKRISGSVTSIKISKNDRN